MATPKNRNITTQDGHPLTQNEALFIDEYMKSGNARQSYLTAYPNVKNQGTASQNAYNLLNKTYIIQEIKFRTEQHKKDSIAEADEILQYFTSVMRGEIKDQFGLDASLGERTKAAQELAKRKIDIPNKLAGNDAPELVIKVDWARRTVDAEANVEDSDVGTDE